jgi:DNA-binding response OmpR family regulator
MSRISIVEDDPDIADLIRLTLHKAGHTAEMLSTGDGVVARLTADPPDLVVLDLMLPGMDGFECCRQMRRSSDVPVLIISARGDSHDVVAGLEAGADDYIRKPFDIPELAARLRALRRRLRSVSDKPDELVAGDIVVHPDRGEVTVAGRPVHLTKTEFHLLYELASSPGRVFSRDMLLQRVWDYGYFGDARIVDVHIRRLRATIEQDSSKPQRLITVRGFGYKLEP